MKCKDIKNLFSPYLEGELNKEERASLESHLEVCPVCKKELTSLEAAIKNVKDLEEVAVPVNLIDKINEKLDRKSFQYRLISMFGNIFHPFAIPVLAKSLVVAASIIIIFYLAVFLGKNYIPKIPVDVTSSSQNISKIEGTKLSEISDKSSLPTPLFYKGDPGNLAQTRMTLKVPAASYNVNPELLKSIGYSSDSCSYNSAGVSRDRRSFGSFSMKPSVNFNLRE